MQLVAVQPPAGKEEKGQGLGYKAMTPSAAQHQAELGTLARSERPIEQSIPPGKDTPSPAHHSPRQGQPTGH